ncbi:uncharacterized protein [Clytia hemisphaerica]|uniref:uncharacterized protein n=1 Tax=Clytia hemisphaerica TaxID=252671 RepID=UPI0034D69217
MRKHGLKEENALALKSQYNLYKERAIKSDADRKSKKRINKRRLCPVRGCSKAPKKLNNHLRQTHHVKKKEVFDRLMRKSELLVESFDDDSEDADESELEEESDYLAFKQILVKERHYLETIESNSGSDSDPDWLVSTTDRWNAKKDKLKEKRSRKRSPDDSEKMKRNRHQKRSQVDSGRNQESDSSSSTSSSDGETEEHKKTDSKIRKSESLSSSSASSSYRETEEHKKTDSKIRKAESLSSSSTSSSDGETEEHEKTDSKIRKAGTEEIARDDYESEDLFEPYDKKECSVQVKKAQNFTHPDDVNDIYEEQSDPVENADNVTEDICEDDEDDDAHLLFVPWKRSVFDEFKSWLQSPDGGLKKPRQAEQHKNQATVILKEASSDQFEMKYLFDRKAIRDKWLAEFDLNRAPGTVKSYLYSLRFFYKFIETDHPESLTQFESKCQEMKNLMDSWITVYRKKQKERTWKNEVKQIQEMLTPDDILKFDQSAQVKSTLASLCSKPSSLSMTNFVNARDYIITSMCLDNAARSGALANMTLHEFKNGLVDGDSFNISVIDHKTLDTSGPCVISLTAELYKSAKVYIRHMRNKLDGVDKSKTSPVFVSWNGNKMSSSMVTGQIKSFWTKCVGLTEKKPTFNATKVRKYAVTKTYEENPGMKKDLAMLMCHSEKTAAKSYYLQEKNKNAAKTSQTLRQIMRSNNSSKDEEEVLKEAFPDCFKLGKATLALIDEKGREKLNSTLQELSDIQLRNKINYMLKKSEKEKENVSESDGDSDFIPEEEDEKEASINMNRADFTIQENNLVNKHFKDLIESKVVIRRKEVGDRCQKYCPQLLEKYGEYKISEKVRKERKKYHKNDN